MSWKRFPAERIERIEASECAIRQNQTAPIYKFNSALSQRQLRSDTCSHSNKRERRPDYYYFNCNTASANARRLRLQICEFFVTLCRCQKSTNARKLEFFFVSSVLCIFHFSAYRSLDMCRGGPLSHVHVSLETSQTRESRSFFFITCERKKKAKEEEEEKRKEKEKET